MVGHMPLEHGTLVRIQASQPSWKLENRNWKMESRKWRVADGNVRSVLVASLGFQGPTPKTLRESCHAEGGILPTGAPVSSFDFPFSNMKFPEVVVRIKGQWTPFSTS